jgi:hypothetical protein
MWVIDEGLAAPFERFHTLIADTQMLCVGASRLPFHYDTLLAPFARCFGEENVVVRPHRGDRAPKFLLQDFLSLLDAPIAFEDASASVERRLNGTVSALAIMAALFRKSKTGGLEPLEIAAREGIPIAPLERTFIGVGPDARERFETQFCESNARVERSYGTSIVFEVPDLPTWQAQDAFSRACLREWNIA